MSTYSKVAKSLRILIWSVLQMLSLVLSALVIFMMYAMLGMMIPYHRQMHQTGEKVNIYVRSNGIHSDICLPLKNEHYNWWLFYDQRSFPEDDFSWVAVGWGDRDFYINTPTWDEFSLNTTLAAFLAPTKSAMHIEMLHDEPQRSVSCEKIGVTANDYINLVDYIKDSFEIKDGAPDIITGATYFGRDRFYNAKRDYHLFETCNSWTNEGLKIAGVRTASWCLFPETIIAYLRQNKN